MRISDWSSDVCSSDLAHLPGIMAALTPVPVFGVPVTSRYLRGEDSLLSIVQMPKGVPVATFAIGEAGAANAALHVIATLAATDDALHRQLLAFRARRSEEHTPEHQSLKRSSYAVFSLKNKNT